MSNKGKFMIYCAEQYKLANSLPNYSVFIGYGSISTHVTKPCIQRVQTISLMILTCISKPANRL